MRAARNNPRWNEDQHYRTTGEFRLDVAEALSCLGANEEDILPWDDVRRVIQGWCIARWRLRWGSGQALAAYTTVVYCFISHHQSHMAATAKRPTAASAAPTSSAAGEDGKRAKAEPLRVVAAPPISRSATKKAAHHQQQQQQQPVVQMQSVQMQYRGAWGERGGGGMRLD